MFQFDADTNATLDTGVWTEFAGAKFKIAHISNMKFQRTVARLQQPHRKKIDNGTLDPKINKEIMCKAMAEGLLMDWRDVVDADQRPVEYTSEFGFKALMNNLELRDFVSDFAMNLQNYRDEEVEDLGND